MPCKDRHIYAVPLFVMGSCWPNVLKKGKMSKKCKVNWSVIDGASPKPKRLHLEKDETDSLYHCPMQECDHDGFQSQRGCRKHVNTKHRWFFYFDEKPNSKEIRLAKASKQFSKREHNSRSNKGDNKARGQVTSLIFIIL